MNQISPEVRDSFVLELLNISENGNKSEDQLSLFSKIVKSPVHYISILISIFSTDQFSCQGYILVADPNTIKSWASTICTHSSLGEILFNATQTEVTNVRETLITGIYSPQIAVQWKESLGQLLTILYGSSSPDIKTLKYAIEQLRDSKDNIIASLCLLRALWKTQIDCSLGFPDLEEALEISGNYLAKEISKNIKTYMNQKDPLIEEKISMNLDTAYKWAFFLNTYVEGISQHRAPLRNFLQEAKLYHATMKVLEIQIPSDSQINECIFWIPFGSGLLDHKLATVKSVIFRYMTSVFSKCLVVQEQKMNDILISSKYFMIIQEFARSKLFQNLTPVCNKTNFKSFAENIKIPNFYDCFCNFITFLILILELNKTQETLNQNQKELFIHICLPLAIFTEPSLEELEEDLQKDTNKFSHLKIKVAQFIEKLAQIDSGFLFHATVIALDLLNFSISDDNLAQINAYPSISPFSDSIVLTAVDADTRISVCLTVLSTLWGKINKREDLKPLVLNTLDKYSQFFSDPNTSVLVKAKLCEFLGESLNSLRQLRTQMSTTYMEILTQYTNDNVHGQLVLSEQASRALLSVAQGRGFEEVWNEILPQIVQELIIYFNETQSKTFFMAFADIMGCEVIKESSAYLEDLVTAIVRRLKLCAEMPEEKRVMKREIEHAIWRIICEIPTNRQYHLHRNEIEQHFEALFLENLNKNSHVEDITTYIDLAIIQSKEISPLTIRILELLAEKLLPEKFEFDHLISATLPVIIQFVIIGKEKYADLILKLTNSLLSCRVGDFKTQIILVLQLILQTIAIPRETLKKMLKVSQDLIDSNCEKFMKARLLEIFLLAFYTDFEYTQEYLKENDLLEEIISSFLQDPMDFIVDAYTIKIYVVSLSAFLVQENLDPIIQGKLPQILQNIVTFLSYIHLSILSKKRFFYDDEDEDELKIGIFKRLLSSRAMPRESEMIEEEDEDNGDDEDYSFRDHCERELLKQIQATFRQQDEFQAFRDAITELNKKNKDLLFELTESLSNDQKKRYKDALMIRQISVANGKIEPRKIIKVKGIKKKEKPRQTDFFNWFQS